MDTMHVTIHALLDNSHASYAFPHSIFENNTSTSEHSSALVAFRFPTNFKGHNHFIGNKGGGITLLNTILRASGTILFESNTAVFGGGLSMDDRCLVSVCLCIHNYIPSRCICVCTELLMQSLHLIVNATYTAKHPCTHAHNDVCVPWAYWLYCQPQMFISKL